MKTAWLILLTAFLLMPMSASAQSYPVDRGSWIVGGSASLTSRSTGFNDERQTSLLINPEAQYFVIPNLAVGGSAGIFFFSFDDDSETSVFLGPAVSYYIGGPNRRLYPFVSGTVRFDVEEFTDSATLLLEGGGAYMVARNVALTGTLFYNAQLEDMGDQNSFGLRFGVSAFVF